MPADRRDRPVQGGGGRRRRHGSHQHERHVRHGARAQGVRVPRRPGRPVAAHPRGRGHRATLLLRGESDDRCPIGQSEQWFAALRERRVPVELVRYPGAGHLFQGGGRPSHRYDYNERMIAWLEQWAGGSRS
ncbi:prolyl oligopeptidase family serine peptidase [[Actinomadura] parvosata]|uniref:prolyl oligopeptidase family serine peptidase n=1 Tax=[Actinomadura] parvosata TaxID=1955412 RepID=UPI00406CC439